MSRIAFLNRAPSAYPGGDILSIADLTEALAHLGEEATYVYGNWTPDDLKAFDIVHIRHMNFSWSVFNVEQTLTSGVPYVLTPIFYPTLNLGAGLKQMVGAVKHASAILPFSPYEWGEMQETLGVTHENLSFVPNGTSRAFHAPDVGTDIDRAFVVTASIRGEDSKGCRDVVKACQEAHLPCEVVTDVPYERMPEVYRRARVFVNASDSERMSRTIGEALCSGCRVLATKHNRGNWWYGNGLVEIDPERDLATAIPYAYNAEVWDYTPNALARNLTWDMVARQLVDVYGGVLEETR